MSFPRDGKPARSGERTARMTQTHPRAAAEPNREGGRTKLRGKTNKKVGKRQIPAHLGSKTSHRPFQLKSSCRTRAPRSLAQKPHPSLPSDAKPCTYLMILLFTPGAGRLCQELFCSSVQEEAEKVLISRHAPGTAILDTVCYLTSGPISGPCAPQAASASWLFNLFSARTGILFE